MGTRHLIAVQKSNEYKIAQYGQWDGYPDGQGKAVLEFLIGNNIGEFSKAMDSISFLTEQEMQEIMDNHTDDGMIAYGSENAKYWKEHLPHLSRDCGSDILSMCMANPNLKLRSSLSFAGDSLFCEYGYVVDLDKMTFEVYEGFNKERLTEGRFRSDDESLDTSNGYQPIKLAKSYDLNALPTVDEFLSDFESDE